MEIWVDESFKVKGEKFFSCLQKAATFCSGLWKFKVYAGTVWKINVASEVKHGIQFISQIS